MRFTGRKSLMAEVVARRLGTASPRKPVFLDTAFPVQTAFITDPAKLKVARDIAGCCGLPGERVAYLSG